MRPRPDPQDEIMSRGLVCCLVCMGDGFVDRDGFGDAIATVCNECEGTGSVSADGSPMPPPSTAARIATVDELKAWLRVDHGH